MKRENRRISLRYEEYQADWPPEDPKGFVAWFEARVGEIPEDFRAEARMHIRSESDYGDSHRAVIEIDYWRPETDEEFAQRKAARAAERAKQEAMERAALAKLKAKYES